MVNNLIFFLKDFEWIGFKYWGIYLLSIFLLPFGLLYNKNFSIIIMAISFIIYIFFYFLNIIRSVKIAIKNNYNFFENIKSVFKAKKRLSKNDIIFVIFLCLVIKIVDPICHVIYYDFLLGNSSFSVKIIINIFILHILIIIGLYLEYKINRFKKSNLYKKI